MKHSTVLVLLAVDLGTEPVRKFYNNSYLTSTIFQNVVQIVSLNDFHCTLRTFHIVIIFQIKIIKSVERFAKISSFIFKNISENRNIYSRETHFFHWIATLEPFKKIIILIDFIILPVLLKKFTYVLFNSENYIF